MSSNPKRTSYFDEETITVKPSTELIPDEYEHFQESQQKIVLHTFVAPDEYGIKQDQKKIFLTTLKNIGIDTSLANIHNLQTDNFAKIIDEIAKGSNTNNDGGLILFFAGFTKRAGQLEIFDGSKQDTVNIQQIWSKFDSHNCPGMKNKPKIFIFAVSTPEPQIQKDSKRHFGIHQAAYDTPAEADILVIYNNEIGDDFLYSFCENIRLFGKTENIITLASSSSPTLIISTLTRNFYFTASNLRGHHHIIDKHNDEIKTNINEIKEALAQKTVKKEKRSILDSFRSKIRKSKTNEEIPHDSSSDNKTKISASYIPTSSKTLSSTNPPRIRENVEPSRSRHVSLSEQDGGKPSRRKSEKIDKPLDKPRWRP